MDLPRHIERARDSIRALLRYGPENSNSYPQMPELPRDISEYTRDRLISGIRFADDCIGHKKRNILPIAHHCLTLYRDTLEDILDADLVGNEEGNNILDTVLQFEEDIHGTINLRRPDDHADDVLNLVHWLPQLRRYELAARYGDYLDYVYEDLQTEDVAVYERMEDFKRLPGWDRYWTDIKAGITKERTLWAQYRLHDHLISHDDVKTTYGIFYISHRMGLNFDRTLESIEMYADRAVHLSIQGLVEHGEWRALREILARDLVDVPAATPSHLRRNIPIIQQTIQAVVDTYFNRPAAHRDDANFWTPKVEAYSRSEKTVDKRQTQVYLAERGQIGRLAAERSRELFDRHAMESSSGDSSGPSRKRVLSETIRRRKEAWDKLMMTEKCQGVHWYNKPFVEPGLWLEIAEEASL